MEYQVIHKGPFLKFDDIEPFVTNNVVTTIASLVPGFVGPVRIKDRKRYPQLVIRNGKRLLDVDFSRGTPVMILDAGNGKMIIVTAKFVENRERMRNVPWQGSCTI